MEGGVRVWELGELEEGREGPWIEVKPWGTLARCGRERGPDLSYRRPSSPLSRGQEIPSFPSRGKVDVRSRYTLASAHEDGAVDRTVRPALFPLVEFDLVADLV